MIGPQQALALRRLLLTMAALMATLTAHGACAGGLGLMPTAPLIWGSLCCLAVVVAPRRRLWREWSAVGLVGRLIGLQLALHLALTGAPWALGVTAHHTPALIAPATLLAHGTAAAVLALALMGAQRVLSAAQRIVRALRGALRSGRALAPPPIAAPGQAPLVPCSVSRRPHSARGPPATAS